VKRGKEKKARERHLSLLLPPPFSIAKVRSLVKEKKGVPTFT
jgi:hypothetical protein